MRFALMSLAALAAMACATGDASAEVRRLEVAGFTGIDASSGIRVDAAIGPGQSAEAEGSPESLARLETKVRDGVLYLSRKSQWFSNAGRIVVRVKAPALDRFEASSGADIRASGLADRDVTASASSGGVMHLEGGCGLLQASASSGGQVGAGGLRCKALEANASSGGQISAFANEMATAAASSGGSIRVGGAPTRVDRSSSSGGNVQIEKN